jgi:hypothetical protein
MNPAIPMTYAELGRWLENFVTSHARREHPGIVVHVDMEEARGQRSCGLRLALGDRAYPPVGAPPIELDAKEVADGRTRFAWCEALAQRIRADARRLLAQEPGSGRVG